MAIGNYDIGGMLARSGQVQGQQMGQAFSQLGQGIEGMLGGIAGGIAAREERKNAERAQQQFDQILGAYQNNPDALRTAGQQMMTNRDPNMQRLGKMLVDEANRVEQKTTTERTGRGTGELLALANDPAFNLNDAKMRSGYLGMADSYGVSRGDAMKIALEAQKSKTQGGSSFRQEIFEPTSGTMQQVNFLMDSSGRVVGQQILGASAGPEKPEISIQKEEGVFYVFEDGIPVSEYESRAAAEAAAKEKNKANDAILKAQRVKLSISDAIGMIENNDNVGGWKQLLKYLPDTEARRFENYLTSIKANVGFDQLLSIKDAGSTLGQVSNIENLLLQSTIDSLDGLMSKDDLVQALNKIDAFYTSLITKAKFGPDAKLKDWAGSVDWMQPEFARMYEQQGGEIVVNENEGTILVKAPNGETIKLLR
jgi:hypothetical protein